MPASALQLEDVQLISEEIRWLVKSHLPLEPHLADAGKGHGARLARLTQSITDGLNRGESLDSLVRQEQNGVPRMLASAVAAGVRCGDLSTAIELMGDLAGDLVELRRMGAIAYPLTVVTCAWLMFVLLLQHYLLQIWSSMESLQISVNPVLRFLMECNAKYVWWPWLVPAVAVLLAMNWVISGRAGSMAFRGPELMFLLLPGVRGLLRDLRFSTLTRMLSLLVEKDMPLPDALRAAGACCGSRSLDAAAQEIARRIESGAPLPAPAGQRWRRGQLPPLVYASLLNMDGDAERFTIRLRAVADHYQSRIALNTMWLRMLMPILLFAAVAGGAVIAYTLCIFWPMSEIYNNLGTIVSFLPSVS